MEQENLDHSSNIFATTRGRSLLVIIVIYLVVWQILKNLVSLKLSVLEIIFTQFLLSTCPKS